MNPIQIALSCQHSLNRLRKNLCQQILTYSEYKKHFDSNDILFENKMPKVPILTQRVVKNLQKSKKSHISSMGLQ